VESRAEVDVRPYQRQASRRKGHGSPSVLISRRGHVLVRTDTALLALDRRYNPHVVWSARQGSTLAAAALAGDRVLVASEGSLIVLDARLREVGRLHFGLRRGKEVHDILVEGSHAMLLDNRSRPLFVFTVDISILERPRLVHRIEGGGVNPHLEYQWYDRAAKRWGILASSNSRCPRQIVHVLDPFLTAKSLRTTRKETLSDLAGASYWVHSAMRASKTTWTHRRCRTQPRLES
jgi:hypothetical protein